VQSNQPQDDVRRKELWVAHTHSENQEWEQAYDIAYKWLKIDPNDPDALNIIGYIMLNTEKAAIAYPILKQLTQIEPENSLAWLNMGMAASDLWRYAEAKRAYKKGIKHSRDDKQKSMQCVNMASTMVDHGDFSEAEPYCRMAIELRDDTTKGKANLGFCQLARRNWAEGWANYRHCINSEWRPVYQYNDEPLWDGKGRGKICIYSEQGLGDEISFAQMLNDMKRWCDKNGSELVIDVNERLENLFRRSFPDVEVHGTRGKTRINWDPKGIKYSLPMGQLGEYFRNSAEKFTGEPYLTADPDRVLQWKALFASKEKPIIGIGWRGGIWKTAAKYRQLDLEQLYPVLSSVDAHWVSLQYKPAGNEIAAFKEKHPDIDIVEYPHGTLSNDYDDTVAMIDAMDMVVSMQTAVIHVAGSLGVPCWVFVPKSSQWRYGQEGEDFPWAKSVRIIRQTKRGEWADVMQKTGDELANHPGLPKAAAGDAQQQEDKLRHSGRKIRTNSGGAYRPDGDRPSA
jgi:hypothetical protein